MSSATATGHCSLIAAYLGGPISEIPSSAVVVMKQEPGGGGGGQASFLLSSSSSKQQQPSPAAHIFPVDLNANDYAFSLEKTLSDSSKAETARPDTDSTSVEEEIGKIKEQQESKSPTLPPPSPSSSYSLRFLSEVNPGLEEHQEISPITWNPVNFGESELKVRGDAEDDKANVKRNSNANRYMNLRKKSKRLSEDRPRQKRQAARDMCRPLKQWLYCHRDTPYPTKAEKQDLALRSRMTLTQVSNWFANARRRLKNTVSGGPDVTWARRIKLYNRFVVGNQELLSVSSEDTMWDDEDITMDADATTTRNEDEEEEEGREGQGRRGSGTFTRWKDRPCGSTRVPSGRYLDADPEEDPAGRRTSTTPTFGPGIPPPPPGKFKQGILQRYLTDACERVVQIKAKKRKNTSIDEDDEEEEEDSEEEEEEEEEEDEEGRREKSRRCHHRNRFRNASGSLSSHDYEEMSLSAPGTPTKEQHHSISNGIQDDAKDNEHRNSSSRDPDDLYWKEISAAMALTSLAMRSRLNSGSSRASSARI